MMFIYISDFTLRSVTNGVIQYLLLITAICSWEFSWICGCHMYAPTWPFCRAWVNTSRHSAARSGGRPVWLLPQSPLKKKKEGRVTDRKNVPGHRRRPLSYSPRHPHPHPQTSTHWTHQVISWGLKYLLGKYLAWLSDPTSQFKDMGLTNFFLYLTNHQDIPRPHPADEPWIIYNLQRE